MIKGLKYTLQERGGLRLRKIMNDEHGAFNLGTERETFPVNLGKRS